MRVGVWYFLEVQCALLLVFSVQMDFLRENVMFCLFTGRFAHALAFQCFSNDFKRSYSDLYKS